VLCHGRDHCERQAPGLRSHHENVSYSAKRFISGM